MTNDQELRRNWRTNWLSSVREFADDETQRRVWLDPFNANPHNTFVEYMCCYFDDLALSDGGYTRAVEQGLLSEHEAEAVADFHRKAAAYHSPTDDYDNQAILADPNWAEVVTAAQNAQATLLKSIEDPPERRYLMGA